VNTSFQAALKKENGLLGHRDNQGRTQGLNTESAHGKGAVLGMRQNRPTLASESRQSIRDLHGAGSRTVRRDRHLRAIVCGAFVLAYATWRFFEPFAHRSTRARLTALAGRAGFSVNAKATERAARPA
jgi:hypothetical protein